jgi:predicted kinase
MGRVIFMCGPAGSGKSAVAQQYERQGMTRLSIDQEAWSRGITTMPLAADVRAGIEHALRARLVELVRAGSDVVLDLSFWSLAMRDEYRDLLRPLGVVPETVYLATDRATVLKRIGDRAGRDGDDFRLSAELAASYFDHFEAPTAAEGPLTVLTSTPAATMAVLFDPEPRTWGLRGDPHLWRALREHLSGVGIPPSADAVPGLLRAAFRELTGVDLASDPASSVCLAQYAHGGMSSGMISLDTWRQRLMPLLAERAGTWDGGASR